MYHNISVCFGQLSFTNHSMRVLTVFMCQWSTPSRLTPATSLPSLLMRPTVRSSLMVGSFISGCNCCFTGNGDVFSHWERVTCCPSVHRRRHMNSSGVCEPEREPLVRDTGRWTVWSWEIHKVRIVVLKSQESVHTACNSKRSLSCWVYQSRVGKKLLFCLLTLGYLTQSYPSSSVSSLLSYLPWSTGLSWEPGVLSVWRCQWSRPPGCTGGSCYASAQRVACSDGRPGYSKQGGSLTTGGHFSVLKMKYAHEVL